MAHRFFGAADLHDEGDSTAAGHQDSSRLGMSTAGLSRGRPNALADLSEEDDASLSLGAQLNAAMASNPKAATGAAPPARPPQSPARKASGAGLVATNKPQGGGSADEDPGTPRQTSSALPPAPAAASGARPGDAPPTARKQDNRKLHAVRIARDDGPPGLDDDEDEDVEESLFETDDAELLRRAQVDLSAGMDSGIAGSDAPSDSGIFGPRGVAAALHKRRNGGAGISMKSAQDRINALTQERDDLKIEVDFHRRKMTPDAMGIELLRVKKELLIKINQLQMYQQLLKNQDKTVREASRLVARWGGKDPKLEAAKMAELEAKARAEEERADAERRARIKAEEELEALKQRASERESETSRVDAQTLQPLFGRAQELDRVQQELEDVKADRDDLLIEIDRLRDRTAQSDRSISNSRQREEVERLREELEDVEHVSRARGAPAQKCANGKINALSPYLKELADAKQANKKLASRHDALAADHERLQRDYDHQRSTLRDREDRQRALERELDVSQSRFEQADAMREEDWARILDEEREVHLKALDALRDELAEARLEGEQRHSDIEALEAGRQEDAERVADLEYELGGLREKVRELEEDLKDSVAGADALEGELEQYKEAVAELEEDLANKADLLKLRDEEVADANKELQLHAERVYELEMALEDRNKEVAERDEEMERMQQEANDLADENARQLKSYKHKIQEANAALADLESQLEVALDAKHGAETALEEAQDRLEKAQDSEAVMRVDYDKLDDKVTELLRDLQEEEDLREEAVVAGEKKYKELEDLMDKAVHERDDALRALQAELDSAKSALASSKADVDKLQSALRNAENEQSRLGFSSANDKHSLELELDRLKRDLARCEADLDRVRKELDRKEEALRERDHALDKARAEISDLRSQHAQEQQSLLGVQDRFETQQRALKEAREESERLQARLDELELVLKDGEVQNMASEQETRTQLTERNTLLLTIFQYLGKILGPEKGSNGTPRRKSEADPRPFTNFPIFHDSLISRLKRISEIQSTFEMRAKEIELKLSEQISTLKRQQETRFRQIDRFEVAVKNATDKQSQWRSRLVTKQGELDAAKATNAELQQQISSLKTRSVLSSPSANSKLTSLTGRANLAERKAAQAQTAATQAEDKLNEMKSRANEREAAWKAQIRELEARCKAAEEKARREKMGGREIVSALEGQVNRLKQDNEMAKRRSAQLETMLKDAEDVSKRRQDRTST
ncbi:hypothetical protein OC842_005686 [Tilletia horrida]|uniref:Centrosomin N-terminal motif 1 domain-containing protein n=1 Tax=Tilletia horrida TaxID=155126 RepID=A0AAN6JIS6_9BASI|nr:hypothetical protein OC842_005686 [Tilletia horrida]